MFIIFRNWLHFSEIIRIQWRKENNFFPTSKPDKNLIKKIERFRFLCFLVLNSIGSVFRFRTEFVENEWCAFNAAFFRIVYFAV